MTVVATAALVGIIALPSKTAATPANGRVYTIASGASGKCVDLTGAGTANLPVDGERAVGALVDSGCISSTTRGS